MSPTFLVVAILCQPPARLPGGEGGWLWQGYDESIATPVVNSQGMPLPEWTRLLHDADALTADVANLDLTQEMGKLNSFVDSHAMAAGLVYLRTGTISYRTQVRAALAEVIGAQPPGAVINDLAIAWCRNVLGYVLAANMVKGASNAVEEAAFRAWLDSTLVTLRHNHEHRPNNVGCHAGASRVAVCLYLGYDTETERCWDVFSRWLGNPGAKFEFALSDWGGVADNLFWHDDQGADPELFGINPPGSTGVGCPLASDCIGCSEYDTSGVLPDDQRRGDCDQCSEHFTCFSWPPKKTGYNYEALQGVLAQAVLHGRRGKPSWSTAGGAILRAYQWLANPNLGNQPINDPINNDDDWWQTWIVNNVYGTNFLEAVPATFTPGKAVGYADWTALNPGWPPH